MSTNYDIQNLTWNDYDNLVKNIILQLDPTNIDIICPVLKGGAILGTSLIHNLKKPSIFIRISRSCSDETNSDFGAPKLLECGDLSQIIGKNILICDDVVDSEKTVQYLKQILAPFNPKSIKVCTLINFSQNTEYIVGKQMNEYKWIVFPWEQQIKIPKFNGLRFIIGEGCNYDCFYCHHEGCYKINKNLLSLTDYEEKIKKIQQLCLNIKLYDIAITGGEPFLYMDKLRILIKYFNKPPFRLIINTNASLIAQYKDEISSWSPIEFHINLSSLEKETHKNIIKTDFFEQEMQSLEFLKSTNHKICLNIICLKTYNSDQLIQLYQFAKNNRFVPRFLIFYDTNKKNKDLILNENEICKILGNKITQKHSYGLIETDGDNPAELVKCLCIDKECAKCAQNTYLHLTTELNIKYCLEKNEIVKIDYSSPLTILKSFEKAEKLLKEITI